MSSEDVESRESLLDGQPNGHAKVVIERPVFSQQKFDEGFSPGSRPQTTFRESFLKSCRKCQCSKDCFLGFLYKIFPFIGIMKDYNIRTDLTGDIVSGLTVGIMHIPQGMAYGMLTTLDPVYGLYTSFFPVIIYFFFGTSRHISIGTFAVACLMMGSAIEKGLKSPNVHIITTCVNVTSSVTPVSNLTNETVQQFSLSCSDNTESVKLQIAMAVTFMVGLIQLVMGLTRLGFVTTYLSDPLISGFTTGAACHVFTSQIKHVFGISTDRYSGAFKLIYTYRDFFGNIPHTNAVTLIASVVCMVMIYVVKEYINNNPKIKPRLKMPVPIELIAVVLGTVIAYFINIESKYGVKIVGDIPTGLPVPTVPNFSLMPDVLSDAFALSIVVFAISVSMGKILARKHGYEIDSNQELFAYAITNMGSSFFSSFATSASLSRSLIQEHVGGVTQLTGLVSSALLLLVLLVLGPYFKTLPKCVLAAIIIVALKGMFRQFLELPKLWKLSKIDFLIWILSFLATVILDVDLGLLFGVVVAIFTIVYRVQRPYVCVLGQMPGTDIYRDVSVYKEAVEIPRVKIFRFENAIFFVSVEHFKNMLFKYTCNPRHVKQDIEAAENKIRKEKANFEKITFQNTTNEVELRVTNDDITEFCPTVEVPDVGIDTIILDCSTWSFIDSMGVKALTSVVNDFREVNIKIHLAFCKAGIREMLEKTGFFSCLNRDNLFVSIHDAVLHTQHQISNSESDSDSPVDGSTEIVVRSVNGTTESTDVKS
ncbi:sulfate transporter-like isoform X2 [Crassostrea angulata]|nr:sulfate transporter-like isoform X2 [Crassostrea angulata]XP_052678618.1 sulfate transporter-like isoform X2 [Crassostrea angulata]XP_052678619.1 sulfate transporter-like isoform X2 [Crassostrea angulata]